MVARDELGGGGIYFYGAIFDLTTSGDFASLYSFGGPDGAFPFAALLQTPDGAFYGTTSNGGASNEGTVFRFAETAPN